MSTTTTPSTPRVRDPQATRERILLAAEDVVLTDGVSCLTLEKAAARAGLSKGGVLYHFKTRNDLVAAMVERLADRFDAGVRAQHAEHAHAPGTFARAYVEECFAPPATEEEVRGERVGAAVIAAVAAEPGLLEPLRAAFRRWQGLIESDSADPVQATIARLAADGLWLCELVGIDALSPGLREQVRDELIRMTTDTTGTTTTSGKEEGR